VARLPWLILIHRISIRLMKHGLLGSLELEVSEVNYRTLAVRSSTGQLQIN
jgi:hypothetical protein